ncbi:hypothetical protein HK097_005170 [Rhizophlyctis rosea]|uniref:Uncharacterized protein n=1 Tax=Rhizophlyctis rosea TaxID=64517 RepID=A0AAD5X3A5_9FUNG|nr:hypothetical protein HK097_005170 [Rhizophlyctis rosea]
MSSRCAKLEKEMKALEAEKELLKTREDQRRQQLSAVIQMAHDLQDSIAAEKQEAEAAAAAANEVELPPTPDVVLEEEEEGAVAEDGDKDAMDLS